MIWHTKFKTGIFFGLLIFMFTLLTSLTLSQDEIDVTVFVDRDALTIYVPGQGNISLQNFGFYVQINGQDNYVYLSDYNAFGLPFASIPTPVCFTLLRNGTSVPLPQVCNPTYTLTQQLNAGDVFWIDGVAANFRTLLVVQGRESLSICAAGNTRCELVYIPPDVVAVELATWANSPKTNSDWTPLERNFDEVSMMLVPPGCFMMGSENGDDDEQPVHEICIEEAFWIDKTEVTNAAYGAISDEDACKARSSEPDQPRNCITWYDARDFCQARGGRLPTEAEWEYAARGTDSLIYPWGNEFIPEHVIYSDNSSSKTASVASRPAGASWVGALDMSGNLWEWTNSLYRPYPYDKDDGRDVDIRRATHEQRVARGGSYISALSTLRMTERSDIAAENINLYHGFRCVRNFE